MSESLTDSVAAEPQRLRRRSATATVTIISAVGATISVIGLIVTVVVGISSMASTGVGFELGYSNTGGTETYVWDEQGLNALVNTAAWGSPSPPHCWSSP